MWKSTPPTDDYPFGVEERPPFPSVLHKDGSAEEFIIPDSEKQAILDAHYPFEDPPSVDDQRYDIHAGKVFFVRDYKLVREDAVNRICSPYYFESGGTIIDWVEIDDYDNPPT